MRWKKGVPVDIIPLSLVPTIARLKALGGNPSLREGLPAKFGPMVTDNGHFVLDTIFGDIAECVV